MNSIETATPQQAAPPSGTYTSPAYLNTTAADENTLLTSPHGPGRTNSDAPLPPAKGLPRIVWLVLVVLVIALAIAIVFGILSRQAAERKVANESQAAAVPTVQVIHPSGAAAGQEISLPGNTQAFTDTPIYARTNGYLRKWYFDIGAHVRKGQLMATIETPEVDDQLEQAQANLKVANANYELAKITSARYQNLLKLDSISKQETDQAVSDQTAKEAAVDAANAAVHRLRNLQSFENVYAPFDGIVTARNTDIGALIQAGSSGDPGAAAPAGASRELFHLAALNEIRVFVPVPETYSAALAAGATARLTLDEFPGRSFMGTIARNSSAIDPGSRTLNVEIDVPNPKGELLPGSYVFVHFKLPPDAGGLTIPSNTLLFRAQGLQVGVVRDGKVQLVNVTLAHDNGATVVVGSGLQPTDNVILDPSDSLATGQEVRVGGVAPSPKPAGVQ